jgi:hypothetical protein
MWHEINCTQLQLTEPHKIITHFYNFKLAVVSATKKALNSQIGASTEMDLEIIVIFTTSRDATYFKQTKIMNKKQNCQTYAVLP